MSSLTVKILTLCGLFIALNTSGQNYWVSSSILQVDSDTVVLVSDKVFNAACLRVETESFPYALLDGINQNRTFSKDEHVKLEEGLQSNLIVFDNPQKTLTLVFTGYRGKLEWIRQYVPPLPKINLAQKRSNCEHPSMVLQAVWRTGLPDPTPGRNATPTEHCIIHHSADGNGNTDYTSLVRSYYIHHTQTNGWDDIGYNYLIANDGTLYAGRDPELPSINQDNVQGAHFCGKNAKTMGICLIGNFMDEEPSFAAINTLTDLLTWKLDKEQFTTSDSFPHPGTNDPKLSVIDGHQAGCNTLCPGDRVWEKINLIRQTVHNKLDQCSNVGIEEPHNSLVAYPTPVQDKLHFSFNQALSGDLRIVNNLGVSVFFSNLLNQASFDASIGHLPPGTYFAELNTNKENLKLKLIKE